MRAAHFRRATLGTFAFLRARLHCSVASRVLSDVARARTACTAWPALLRELGGVPLRSGASCYNPSVCISLCDRSPGRGGASCLGVRTVTRARGTWYTHIVHTWVRPRDIGPVFTPM